MENIEFYIDKLKSNEVKKTILTQRGKVLLGAGVFVAMALFAVLAGQNIGEDLGEFIYNISH